MPFAVDFIAGQMNLGYRRIVRVALENIFCDVHQHRTRTAGRSDVKRFVDDLRQVAMFLTRKLCFVAERVMPNVSASWNASVPSAWSTPGR